MRFRLTWIQLQCGFVMSKRGRMVTFACERAAEIAVRFGRFRVQADRQFQIGQGFLQLSGRNQFRAKVARGIRVARI